MKQAIVILAAITAIACHQPAHAAETSTIVVTGVGTVTRPPDTASFSGSLRGEGKTSVDALRALAALRDSVEAKLESLAGADAIKVTASEMKVRTARRADCDENDYDADVRLSDGRCALQGFVATLDLSVGVRPAKRIGDAASLAAELGVWDVAVEGSALDSHRELREAATAAAMSDAREKAARIAAGGGVRLGRLTRVQDEQARYGAGEMLVVTAQKRSAPAELVRPSVPVDIEPEDVTETVRLIVTYEIAD